MDSREERVANAIANADLDGPDPDDYWRYLARAAIAALSVDDRLIEALEWWDRQATSWLGTREEHARPGWMQPAIEKGRDALLNHKGRPMTDRPAKQTCTADNPAPRGTGRGWYGLSAWDYGYRHPDATKRCIDDDHDDWRYDCPHCGCGWIYEGPDA